MTQAILLLTAIALESFKFGGVRYTTGDPAPELDELIAAGLVGMPEQANEGTDEAGDGIVGAETDIGIDEAPGEKAPDTGEKFRVEHRGSGRWYIIDAEGKAVSEALTKVHAVALADEMNAAG